MKSDYTSGEGTDDGALVPQIQLLNNVLVQSVLDDDLLFCNQLTFNWPLDCAGLLFEKPDQILNKPFSRLFGAHHGFLWGTGTSQSDPSSLHHKCDLGTCFYLSQVGATILYFSLWWLVRIWLCMSTMFCVLDNLLTNLFSHTERYRNSLFHRRGHHIP